MVSRQNSASQLALYNLTSSSPSTALYDDESQLLNETELDTLGDDGQPANVRRRTLTCWPLMLAVDALGLLALAGVAQATDSSQPITPASWLAATAVLALVFATFALLPVSKLVYYLHLHAFGFAYCMLIHTGLHVRSGSGAVHRLEDTVVNWPFLLFGTPLCFIFGASATLREQPGIDLAALLPASLASSLQALLTALGAAPLAGGADARQALAAHTHNFGYYFVPFVLGTLPNFLAKVVVVVVVIVAIVVVVVVVALLVLLVRVVRVVLVVRVVRVVLVVLVVLVMRVVLGVLVVRVRCRAASPRWSRRTHTHTHTWRP
jgi:hypothetical protein